MSLNWEKVFETFSLHNQQHAESVRHFCALMERMLPVLGRRSQPRLWKISQVSQVVAQWLDAPEGEIISELRQAKKGELGDLRDLKNLWQATIPSAPPDVLEEISNLSSTHKKILNIYDGTSRSWYVLKKNKEGKEVLRRAHGADPESREKVTYLSLKKDGQVYQYFHTKETSDYPVNAPPSPLGDSMELLFHNSLSFGAPAFLFRTKGQSWILRRKLPKATEEQYQYFLQRVIPDETLLGLRTYFLFEDQTIVVGYYDTKERNCGYSQESGQVEFYDGLFEKASKDFLLSIPGIVKKLKALPQSSRFTYRPGIHSLYNDSEKRIQRFFRGFFPPEKAGHPSVYKIGESIHFI